MGVNKRKFIPSSSSSEFFDSGSGACSIEFFMASKDPFRVAPGLKIPMPWPFRPSSCPDEVEAIVNAIRSKYEKVLLDCGIKGRRIEVQRLVQKYTAQSRYTLVIDTMDENTTEWKGAATWIQEILDAEIRRQNSAFKISVEIRNFDLMYRDVTTALKANTAAHQALEPLQPRVYELVKSLCSGNWTTISYVMRGLRDESKKPTIIIGIKEGSRGLWAHVENQISEALVLSTSSTTPIYLELIPGHAELLVSKEYMEPSPLPQLGLPRKPVNGSSIGPRLDNKCAGSLGIWVYFQPTTGFSTKKICFLTCYHVISKGERDPKKFNNNQKNGIGLNKSSIGIPIQVDYPAPFDAKLTRELAQSAIAKNQDPIGEWAATLQTMDSHFNAGGIGSVIYASGYDRRVEKHRMDWAIISLHSLDVFQQNKPPLKSQIPPKFLMGDPYTADENVVVTAVGEPIIGSWAAKIGRTTGLSVGDVNSIDALVCWEDGTESNEISVMNFDGGMPFADKGDSGAMVVNIRREWVGMAFGKYSGMDCGFITSAKNIIADIEASCGGKISLA